MAAAVAEAETHEEWLEGPAAAAERDASRTAYSDEGRSGAELLLSEKFEEVLAGLEGDPARVLSNLQIEAALGSHAAQIADQDGSGGSEMIESTFPIQDRPLGGLAAQPVDLSLQPVGDTFVSRNPVADVRLPGSADGVVGLTGGVAITDLPGDGDARASRFGDMDLFYPETDVDTDTLITPVSGGVEIFNQLRSPESPEELRFELRLPKGASLVPDGDGARIQESDGSLIRIPAPQAIDAQQAIVPVELAVEGESLLINVPHRGAEVAYPVLLDPYFLDENYPWSWGNWKPAQVGRVLESDAYYGLAINAGNIHVNSSGGDKLHRPGSRGYWYFEPPGSDSYVSGVSFGAFAWETPGIHESCWTAEPHAYWGIADTNGSWPNLQTVPGSQNASGPAKHSGWVGHPGSRWAIVGIEAAVKKESKCVRNLDIAGASVTMDDNNAPSISGVSGPGVPVGKLPSQLSVAASDSGLGLSAIRIEYNGLLVGNKFTAPSGAAECGYYSQPCGNWNGPIAFNTNQLPEGNVALTVKAIDAVDNWAAQTAWIAVDHTPPGTIIDSGPASNAAVAASTATFTFHATEGGSTFECKLDSAAYAPCSGAGYTTANLASGAHELQIRATDPAGNTNNAPTKRAFYAGAPDTVIDSGPSGLTNDDNPGFEYHGTQIGAGFECRIDSAAFSGCSSEGFLSPPLGNGVHSFAVRAVNTGLADATPASRSFTVDTVPPVPDIVGGPTGPTNQTTPTFAFTKDAGVTAVCSIDVGTATFDSCSGATTHQPTGPLGQQTYSFRVRETDAAGNESPTVKRTFTVDTVAPQTTIESGPTGVTANSFPRFDLDSSEPDAGFECRVDEGEEIPCGQEYVVTELEDGQHRIYASAEDEAGNVDASPATRTFAVDTTAPGASIDSGPAGQTADSTPTFVFSTASGATVSCAIEADGGDFDQSDYRACSTGTSDTAASALPDGGYTFHLQVRDDLENENTVDRRFTVDTAAPDTLITTGPEGATDDTQPTFGFSASEGRVKYECQLDAGPFAVCSGPGPTHSPAAMLADGVHTFAVRAVDRAGATDPTAATRSFTVDTQKPQTTIQSGPSGPTLDETPEFAYSASEPGTMQCRIDAEAFTGCPAASIEVDALDDGQHTIAVRALDVASNPDPTPARRTFVVDTEEPATPVATGQLRDPETPGVTLRVEVSDGSAGSPSTIRSGVKEIDISIDGVPVYSDEMPCVGAFKTCPDHLSRELELPYRNVLGTHVYRVDTADALGQPSKTVEWTEYTPNDGTVITYVSGGDGCGPLTEANAEVVRNPKEHSMRGGPKSDLIVAEPGFPTIYGGPGCDVIIGSYAKETIRGGAGHDTIRGKRSNDVIFGEEGDDQIFGGIGDDDLRGNAHDDYLDGGPGADLVEGEGGNDTVRGGQGIDILVGQGGNDTVSFADAVGPGFPRNGSKDNPGLTTAIGENLNGVAGFPGGAKTGVFVNLSGKPGGNGVPRDYASNGGGSNGGGMDYLYIPKADLPTLPGEAQAEEPGGFENIVGSAFADVIRGSTRAEEVWGGPGPDVLRGGGGADRLDGGIHGDFIDGSGAATKLIGGESEADRCVAGGPGAVITACGSSEDKVVPRDPVKLAIGIQDPDSEDHGGIPIDKQHANVFVDGSTSDDFISIDYPSPSKVVFTVKTGAEVAANACSKASGGANTFTVTCGLDQRRLGSVIMLGGDGNDTLNNGNLDRRLPGSVVMLGGPGRDVLNGTATDELLLDGQQQGGGGGEEKLTGGGGDDVLMQGDGKDRIEGGDGHDLLMSSEICNGDTIVGDAGKGDTGRDNAQFAKLDGVGVFADLNARKLGDTAKGNNSCQDGSFDPLREIDDVEGSPQHDVLEGNGQDNLLIGRGKPDVLKGFGGSDTLNSRDLAADYVVDCGGQNGDIAHIDMSADNRKAIESDCETTDSNGEIYKLGFELLEMSVAESDPGSSGFNTASTSAATPAALTSAYPLDEESGVVADNVVEEEDDGLYRNADIGPAGNEQGPDLGVPGAALGEAEGTAVELDGVNDYIELGEEPQPNPEAEEETPEGHSVEFWVKFDQAPLEREYLYSGMEGGEGPFLFRAADGSIVFGTHTEAGSPEVQSGDPIDDGLWHHVVGTLEGEEVALYVDGFPHRLNYGQPVLTEESEPETEVVGASSALDHFVDGTVDDLVIYEGALAQDEVVFHLASSKAEAPETLLAPEPDLSDSDDDSVPDSEDNCPEVSNGDQADADLDGVGDACLAPDADGDGVADADDDCPDLHNPDQLDRDEDGLGAECDPDELRVATGAATDLSPTMATLNATVNPEGTGASYQFEYGISTSYESKAPSVPISLGTGIEVEGVSRVIGSLAPGTVYHYRVAATTAGVTTYGEDRTFETMAAPDIARKLAALAIAEPFDGSTASTTAFNSNWAALGWAGGGAPKGGQSSSGWGPSNASTVNGAYFNPTIAPSGWGTGVAARMAAGPSIEHGYFSLWLDMPNPASVFRSGYELRFTHASVNTYNVWLRRWVNGNPIELATKANHSFATGNSFAIVDLGGTVSAWTDTGSGYTQLLSATDSTYDGGRAGVEGVGTLTRLNLFKARALNTPEATTAFASAVKGTTATLNGTVNPEGTETSYHFEFGPTTAYGTQVPVTAKAAGAGTLPVAVAATQTGLTGSTTYHYRLVATSEAGIAYGEDRTLTTLKAPKATTDAASAVKGTTATLNGTVNPEGTETSYHFEFGPTTAYGTQIPVPGQSVGAGTTDATVGQTLSSLSPNTTYHYRLVASSPMGTTFGADQSFTTKSIDVAAKLAALAITEPFDGSAATTTAFSTNWSALGWAEGSYPKGALRSNGWGPSNPTPTVNGAYFKPVITESGWGTAAAARMAVNPGGGTTRHFSLWLDVPDPAATTRSGYELRFSSVNGSYTTFNVRLGKWVNGNLTELATKVSYAFVDGGSLAIVDLGGTVSAWGNTGSGYTQLLSATDSAYDGGRVGVEGAGNLTRLDAFKVGRLNFPKATTDAASAVKGTTATLNGTVNPEGTETSYHFEFGLTTAYGTQIPVPAKATGDGTNPMAVAETQTGLNHGTTYHYRLVATSEAGIAYGEDRTLTTLKAPKATTDAASAVKGTTATLNGTVNPEGTETSYHFEFGPTTAYGTQIPVPAKATGDGTNPMAVAETQTGLNHGTTYHYRLVATSEAGTALGSDQTFTTKSIDVAAKLAALAITEPFDGSAATTTAFSTNWSALGWAEGSYPKGALRSNGWGPSNTSPTVNGASFNTANADSGWGTGAAVRMAVGPAGASRYFSLWLDMPDPAAATRSGYELRFTFVAANTYTVRLGKWVNGTLTELASKANHSFATGNSFAIVDLGGTVSAWTDTGSGYTQLLSASDSAYDAGRAGVEGAGNLTRLDAFKVGALNVTE